MKNRVGFGAERAERLQFGQAIITVPKVARARGTIIEPNWFERHILKVPQGGDASKHFTVPSNGVGMYVTASDFIGAVLRDLAKDADLKEHAFLFVHGYRVTFDAALFRTAQIAYDLQTDGVPFGAAFLYSWPAGGDLVDYKYDFDSARLSVEYLKEFVDIIVERTGVKNVHVIAHSMGNWPLLSALSQVAPFKPGTAKINQVVLAAPDIDAKEYVKMVGKITSVVGGVTLYVSASDLAMQASRKVHRGSPRAGDITATGPVVTPGVDTIDISAVSTAILSLGHAGYADTNELLNDMRTLFRQGARPPHVRKPIKQVQDREYWMYPQR